MRTFLRAIVDEARLVFLDAGVLIITVLAVIVYAFFYPLPYLNQVMKDVPIAVVDQDHSALGRRLVRMADGHQSIKVAAEATSVSEAEALVREGAVAGVLVVPRGFESDVLEGRQAHVTGQIDAAYLLTYNTALAGLMESVGTLSAGVEEHQARLVDDRAEEGPHDAPSCEAARASRLMRQSRNGQGASAKAASALSPGRETASGAPLMPCCTRIRK